MYPFSCLLLHLFIYPLEAIVILSSASKDAKSANENKQNKTNTPVFGAKAPFRSTSIAGKLTLV